MAGPKNHRDEPNETATENETSVPTKKATQAERITNLEKEVAKLKKSLGEVIKFLNEEPDKEIAILNKRNAKASDEPKTNNSWIDRLLGPEIKLK